MKKKLLTIAMGLAMTASVGYAAPVTDLPTGETRVGYNHYDMNSDIKNDNVYLESAVSDKFTVGIERSNYSDIDFRTTDIYAQYKVDPNIRLIVGNRDYSDADNKMFYGVGANVNLAPKVDGYMSVTTSSIATEWQTGLNYKLNPQTAIQFGYKSYDEDHASKLDGVGFGINHTF